MSGIADKQPQLVPLANGVLNVTISTQGGEIVSATTSDMRPFLRLHDQRAGFTIKSAACFPTVPIGNRVEGNRFVFDGANHARARNTEDPLYIHGDGWLSDWRLESLAGETAKLSFSHEPSAASPFGYRTEQSFSLDGPTLRLKLVVTNTSGRRLPFGLGFHPFFPRTERITLFAPATDWWTERSCYLPDEKLPVPDIFDFSAARILPDEWINSGFEGWPGVARIVWPENRLGVDVHAGLAMSGHYMIYAPDANTGFFCFEPMSHSPNALATVDADLKGLRALNHSEAFAVEFAMTVFDWRESDG